MKKKPHQSRIQFAGLLVILLTWAFMTGTSAGAQRPNQWSPQQQIPGYKAETLPPYLVPDQNRTIHAFSSQQVGDEGREIAIIYSQWTLEQGWNVPVDILLSPIKHEARLLAAFLDQTGMMHVIFFGGDNTEANIYYSKAPAVNAGQASAWSAPDIIGEGALDPANGALAGDDKGNLVILFSGSQLGNGLYGVYSSDGGSTWSDPTPIFLTENDQLWPSDSTVYLGESGQLYTVWSTYDIAGHGVAVYFASLGVGHTQWSDPLQLAAGTGLGVSQPNVIEYEGDMLIAYYNSEGNALWLIRSSDNGQNWTLPVRIAPNHIGRNGAVSMVRDSNDILHLLFGERVPGSPDIHGMWHTTYQNNRLSAVESVVSGPLIVDKVGDKGFDPGDARAVISQGNVILVTWRTDPGNGINGVWFSYSILNAPELPLMPLPTPRELPGMTATPTAALVTNSTQSNSSLLQDEREYLTSTIPRNVVPTNEPAMPLVVSLIPVVLLIAVTITKSSLRRHNHRR
jgi:hypothetical protein